LELYFRQQNDWQRKEGIYLKFIHCANFIDAMSETRLQDEYNEAIRHCDIPMSLFSTKAGNYTVEEFDVACQAYKETKRRPKVYTFFKNAQINMMDVDQGAMESLWKFKNKLKDLEHFYTNYDDIADLKLQFSDQLRKLREDGGLKFFSR
jgi:internalin A